MAAPIDSENARGLDLTARALTKIGPRYRCWPSVRTSEGLIDQLVVGPTGVWVIAVARLDQVASVEGGRLHLDGVDAQTFVKTVERRTAVASQFLRIPARAIVAVPGALSGASPQVVSRVRLVPTSMVAAYIAEAPSEMPPERLAETLDRAESWKRDAHQFFRREASSTTARPDDMHRPTTAFDRRSMRPARPRRSGRPALLALFLVAGFIVYTSAGGGWARLSSWWSGLTTDAAEMIVDDLTRPDTSSETEVQPDGSITLGPLQATFVCSELNGTYWMRLRVTDPFAGPTRIALTLGGTEFFVGEHSPFQPIDAVESIAPGSPITITAAWDSIGGDAPGDLRRSFTAPEQPCV